MSKRATLLVLGLAHVAIGVSGGCAKKTSAAAPMATNPAAVVRGRMVYAKYCATCHGPAANGYAADNAPSLRTTTFLATASDVFLREGITRGRPGTAMGAYGRVWGGPLPPADVDAVIGLLRAGGPRLVELPAPKTVGDATRGKLFYDTICARCHGTQTQRSSAVHLANPVFLATATDSFLRFAIESGRPPTSMVPWKETLRPAQIDDVVAYVRSFTTPIGAPPPAHAFEPPPAAPRTGPIVLNPKGRAPEFTLKENLYVSIDDVKKALDEKRRMVITDARAPGDYLSLHITGAISTPYYDKKSLDDLPNDGTWVLAYCACPHHVSGEVVEELRKRGYKHTAVIDEGIFAWQTKKYPVVATAAAAVFPAPPPALVPGGAHPLAPALVPGGAHPPAPALVPAKAPAVAPAPSPAKH